MIRHKNQPLRIPIDWTNLAIQYHKTDIKYREVRGNIILTHEGDLVHRVTFTNQRTTLARRGSTIASAMSKHISDVETWAAHRYGIPTCFHNRAQDLAVQHSACGALTTKLLLRATPSPLDGKHR